MKKTLPLILALLLVLVLSTGTVLAKSDNGNAKGSDKSNPTQSDSVKPQVKQPSPGQVEKSSKVEKSSQVQKATKNIQEKVKKSLQEEYKAYKQKSSPDKVRFSDVNQHWAMVCIKEITAIGIFKGYPDGTFKPDQQLSQAEALALVMRINSDDVDTATDDDSTTVDADENENESDDSVLNEIPAWARDDAGKAIKKGIIKLNRFHSGMQASRAQTAVMIAKALGLEPVDTSNIPFKDGLLISQEDVGYILALYQEGILTGTPNGNFNPNSAITRAEMAAMIQRLLNKSEIESITLPATATVEQGKSVTLEATVKYTDGSSDTQVSWSSSDSTMATVDKGVVTAAADKTGTVTITATATRGETSKSATCTVTVVEKEVINTGTLEATGNVGGHEGKVYQEYALKVDGTTISLAQDKVKSIKLQKEGSDAAELAANTDTNLWFNVQRETGKYVLTVIDNNDKSYTATLDWTAPVEVTATATGNTREIDSISYAEYKIGDLGLFSYDNLFQIEPNGTVLTLTSKLDTNLWFQTTNQVAGKHTFLIKKDGVWYSSSINS